MLKSLFKNIFYFLVFFSLVGFFYQSYSAYVDNKIFPQNPGAFKKMTQEFTESFHDAAHFYIASKKSWLKKNKKKFGVVVPVWRCVDIDDLDDWKNAELLFDALKCQKK